MFNQFRASSHCRIALVAMMMGGIWFAACTAPTPTGLPDDPSATVEAATRSAALTASAQPDTPTATLEPTPTPEPTSTPQPTPTQTQTSSPTPLIFNVTGEICFPSETIPSMLMFFEDTETSELRELPISEGQTEYEIKLDPGIYIVYAWLPDYSRGGLYSRAVPCGLGSECDDHTILPFSVTETEIQEGIDVCDWFAGPFNVPYPPGRDRSDVTGTITGGLSYLNADIPELRVVAFNTDIEYWYWVNTQPGQVSYAINELPPGTYNVVAYDDNGNAGGHASGNHVLFDVIVEPGGVTGGINVNDWSAPPGTFPPDPTR